MRKLIFLNNFPCSIEETKYLEEYNLLNNTLFIDNFKTMVSGLDLIGSQLVISEKNNFKVFSLFFDVLEERMKNGLLTVIKENSDFNERFCEKFKILCKKHNYEAIVVDYTFNKYIERKFSFAKYIKPDMLDKELQIKFVDLSKYKRIVHIGDIHGCATALKSVIHDIKFNYFYIFLGDYIDRGIENAEVVKFLLKIRKYPNVIFLHGNHEFNLTKYANGDETYKIFEETKAELDKENINLYELKDFCNRMQTYFAYQYKGKKVLCTHGGLSTLKNIHLISETSFILGSDDDNTDIDKLWEKNVSNIYQIHGHRNEFSHPINAASNSFNLEGAVELGGNLRILELENSIFHYTNIKNNVYLTKDEEDDIIQEVSSL